MNDELDPSRAPSALATDMRPYVGRFVRRQGNYGTISVVGRGGTSVELLDNAKRLFPKDGQVETQGVAHAGLAPGDWAEFDVVRNPRPRAPEYKTAHLRRLPRYAVLPESTPAGYRALLTKVGWRGERRGGLWALRMSGDRVLVVDLEPGKDGALRVPRKATREVHWCTYRDDLVASIPTGGGKEDVFLGDAGAPSGSFDWSDEADYVAQVICSLADANDPRVRQALQDTTAVRDAFIDAACIDPVQRERIRAELTVDHLVDKIERQREFKPKTNNGLAQFLAERGLLPMYGMPTRVRQLYLGLRAETDERDTEYSWSTMDRDLDTAVFEFAPGNVLTKDKQRHLVVGFCGTLAQPERRGKDIVLEGLSHWIESEHNVAMCDACGSAKYSLDKPSGTYTCDDCGADVEADEFSDYITPAAFRTDFKESDLDSVGRMTVRTVATVLRDGEPVDAGGLRVRRGAGVTIMQLNDGTDDNSGSPPRFTVQEVEDTDVRVPRMSSVALSASQVIEVGSLVPPARWVANPASQRTFGLIAKKETDALYLELMHFDERLTLDRVARKGAFSHLPTRSAAISATQILVQKAALDLDVAADEFEALEPRLREGRPMLQMADSLINGSGLSRRLGDDRSDGTPHIVHLIGEILSRTDVWPLVDFLLVDEEGDHAARCQTSCYRCIQRYGNRSYHGLLDWRLGLAYLRALVTQA